MDWEAFCSLMSLTCMREPLSLPGYVGFTYFEFWSIRSENWLASWIVYVFEDGEEEILEEGFFICIDG